MRAGALLLSLALTACIGHAPMGDAYIGARYMADPLGEDAGYDPDPLIRFDAFDCTTFVETVFAHGDIKKLNKIRYANGVVDFVHRNHFIETDWIKNNAAYVENISARVAPTARRRVTIDRGAWMRKVHGMDDANPAKTVDLEYVPHANIPAGMRPRRPLVVLFIHDGVGMREKIGTDLAITHMGFLMPDGMLRHASSRAGYVLDENFDDYVAMRKKSRHNLGVMLLEIK